MEGQRPDITTLLAEWRGGDGEAGNRLMERIYREVRGIAERHLSNERRDHTLQPTALVHEVYLEMLEDGSSLPADDRIHLFALVAKRVRRVLAHHARRKGREKRGGDLVRVAWSELGGEEQPDMGMVELDMAMGRLAEVDPEAANVVELRFFAGLTREEIAMELEFSETKVFRKWTFARRWLHRQLF